MDRQKPSGKAERHWIQDLLVREISDDRSADEPHEGFFEGSLEIHGCRLLRSVTGPVSFDVLNGGPTFQLRY